MHYTLQMQTHSQIHFLSKPTFPEVQETGASSDIGRPNRPPKQEHFIVIMTSVTSDWLDQ